jgi:hypothetical protein
MAMGLWALGDARRARRYARVAFLQEDPRAPVEEFVWDNDNLRCFALARLLHLRMDWAGNHPICGF